jgi:hypothetical protein
MFMEPRNHQMHVQLLYACGIGNICDTYGGEEKCGKPEGRGSLGKCRPRWHDDMKLDSLIHVETKGL